MESGFDRSAREFYADHFDYLDPRETALREAAVGHLPRTCPVTHSDAWGGFWVANGYEQVATICRDTQTYSSAPQKRITPLTGRPMPPIDFDPPVHQDYRRILNPLLTPRRVAIFEPGVRSLVTNLIDGFIDDGHCDLAGQFAKQFPARMLYRYLFGIDDADVPQVQGWTEIILCQPFAPDIASIKSKWYEWICGMLDRRRHGPRQEDLIDGLLHGTVEGRPITDEEIVGCIENLILGGFFTTSDAILNAMLRMAERPELQEHLRADPTLIPKAIDEFVRFDSPVAGVARLCTRDTILADKKIKEGDRVWVFFGAANRDGEEFDDPNVIDLDRTRNRHLAFGVGPHRCVGSNVGRLNLKVALEELLSRLGPFQVTPGDSVRRVPSPSWGIDYLPLTFERTRVVAP